MPQEHIRYSIYANNFGGVLLRDLSEIGFQSASKKSIVVPGGDVSPQAVVTCCADPVINGSTRDLVGLLAGSPSISVGQGYRIDTGGSPPTSAALLQFQKRAPTGGSAFVGSATAEHLVGTSAKGFLVLNDISVRQDDEEGAKCSFTYTLLSSDGHTAPMTFSAVSALGSSPAFNGIFYLGPVRLGQIGSSLTNLPGVIGWTYKTGIEFRAPRADGCIWPINGSMYSKVPELRITVNDLQGNSNLISTPWHAGFVANTAFNLYLQRGVHGGARYATNQAQHMVLTCVTGDQTTDSISVQRIDDATSEIIVRPTGVVNFNTAQTIG